MANVIDETYIMQKVKTLLPMIGDASVDIYDPQLDILIGGAINKLVSEGINIDETDKDGNYIFTEDTRISKDYCICVSYQCMKDLDYDANMDYLTEQYITRIGTLRGYIAKLKNG